MPIIIAIVLIVVGLYACGSGSTASECRSKDSMAAIMAENFVEQRLRSPSTAEFGPSHRAEIRDTGKCKYRVANYVDAQNGFGATIRTRFVIDMERVEGTNSWRGSNIVMD